MRRAPGPKPMDPPNPRLYAKVAHLAHVRMILKQAIAALKVGRTYEALDALEELDRSWL